MPNVIMKCIKAGLKTVYINVSSPTLSFSKVVFHQIGGCTNTNCLVAAKYWRLESWKIQPSKKSYSVSKVLMMLQMIVHQNNEGRRSGPQYVIVGIPVILSFIFSHPLGFNVITEYTW